jgi:hypothetical protein
MQSTNYQTIIDAAIQLYGNVDGILKLLSDHALTGKVVSTGNVHNTANAGLTPPVPQFSVLPISITYQYYNLGQPMPSGTQLVADPNSGWLDSAVLDELKTKTIATYTV